MEYENSSESDPVTTKTAADIVNETYKYTGADKQTPKDISEAEHAARDHAEETGYMQRGSASGSGGKGGKK